MSKFLLVLCLLIGSYTTANAGFVDSLKKQVEVVKDKITDMVNSAINTVTEALMKAKGDFDGWVDQARRKAEELAFEVTNTINGYIVNLDMEIDAWIEDAKNEGVDAYECRKIADEVRHTAKALVVNTTSCLTNKIDEGTYYVKDINNLANKVYDDLTKVKDDASVCFDGIDGFTSAMKALGCVNNSLRKVTSIINNEVPRAIGDITRLGVMIETLIPNMAYCLTTTSISTFRTQIDGAIQQVKICINAEKNNNDAITTALPY